jgi:hypothetical protein
MLKLTFRKKKSHAEISSRSPRSERSRNPEFLSDARPALGSLDFSERPTQPGIEDLAFLSKLFAANSAAS